MKTFKLLSSKHGFITSPKFVMLLPDIHVWVGSWREMDNVGCLADRDALESRNPSWVEWIETRQTPVFFRLLLCLVRCFV